MDLNMPLLLYILGFSLIAQSKPPLRRYYYVNMSMTWHEAQLYCRKNFNDLATFESMKEIQRLGVSELGDIWTWIGLRDDPQSWQGTMGNDGNSWRWSATGETSKTGYQNWHSNEPNYETGKEECAIMDNDALWYDTSCQNQNRFVCYTETNDNQKTYVFVDEQQTFINAQNHCRTHYTDLAVIENSIQNAEVSSVTPHKVHAWIGLYRIPWTWSDQTHNSFRNWKTGGLNNAGGNQHCMTENALEHVWDDALCDKKYLVLCQEVYKRKTIVKVMIKTDIDMTDPSANNHILQQLGAALQSQGWTRFTLLWKIQPKKQQPETLHTA